MTASLEERTAAYLAYDAAAIELSYLQSVGARGARLAAAGQRFRATRERFLAAHAAWKASDARRAA